MLLVVVGCLLSLLDIESLRSIEMPPRSFIGGGGRRPKTSGCLVSSLLVVVVGLLFVGFADDDDIVVVVAVLFLLLLLLDDLLLLLSRREPVGGGGGGGGGGKLWRLLAALLLWLACWSSAGGGGGGGGGGGAPPAILLLVLQLLGSGVIDLVVVGAGDLLVLHLLAGFGVESGVCCCLLFIGIGLTLLERGDSEVSSVAPNIFIRFLTLAAPATIAFSCSISCFLRNANGSSIPESLTC